MRFLPVLIVFVFVLSGCKDAVESLQPSVEKVEMDATRTNEFPEDKLNKQLTPFLKASNENPSSYVNNMRYIMEDFEQIFKLAQEKGIKNPFLPTVGIGTEYVLSVEEENNALKISFPHFSIRESTNDFIPKDASYITKLKKTSSGDFYSVFSGDAFQLIYTIKDGLFVSISSAKPFSEEEYGMVLESIVPMIQSDNIKSKGLLYSTDGSLKSIYEMLASTVSVYEISWAPNNKYVMFAKGNPVDGWGHAYIWKVGDHEPIQLNIGLERISGFIFSPNEQYVLLDVGTSPSRGGYLINASNLSVGEPFTYMRAVFSPDSKFLALGTPSDHDITNVAISPSEAYEISLYNNETNEIKVVVKTDDVHNLYPLNWRDNKTLIYKKVYASSHEEYQRVLQLDHPELEYTKTAEIAKSYVEKHGFKILAYQSSEEFLDNNIFFQYQRFFDEEGKDIEIPKGEALTVEKFIVKSKPSNERLQHQEWYVYILLRGENIYGSVINVSTQTHIYYFPIKEKDFNVVFTE